MCLSTRWLWNQPLGILRQGSVAAVEALLRSTETAWTPGSRGLSGVWTRFSSPTCPSRVAKHVCWKMLAEFAVWKKMRRKETGHKCLLFHVHPFISGWYTRSLSKCQKTLACSKSYEVSHVTGLQTTNCGVFKLTSGVLWSKESEHQHAESQTKKWFLCDNNRLGVGSIPLEFWHVQASPYFPREVKGCGSSSGQPPCGAYQGSL